MLNRNLLKSKLALKGFTIKELAEKMELNYPNFSLKIRGKVLFSPQEIQKIQEILELTNDEVVEIFIKN
ncbi:DUF739 domain-containing protein [Fusobacterium necrophorum]|uniref:Repressor n=2 Tax=Fusobacterium necrophorum TaxID=859 RepID=A0AB73BW41_9FUSO|nr:helix-turn-helix domain-containing protein [Fusobacterium necrophorum]AYZ73385.1 DUF739 domain-containing protein [Fusobacterium necrophorum]AZW08618.1 DUF739 domain-containing protein [Fusobacterium necrophorum subsp. necrophorum]KDE63036.1 repressor [Fusobacterium necrophorum BL]KDE65225.1 repressor-like protein [Fusobacterium necrophorum BFTR-1]KDE67515.1 hypothetical protein FUSO4_02985 [Fusobacterium necrophorum DJ-1]